MEFTFACPHCGQAISAMPGQAGFNITCLRCKATVTVPSPAAAIPPPLPAAEPKSFAKSAVVFGLGLLSAVYLINPTAGIVELIPDNFPIIGNLDEAAATILIIRCLAYFGIDLAGIMKSVPKKTDPDSKPPPGD